MEFRFHRFFLAFSFGISEFEYIFAVFKTKNMTYKIIAWIFYIHSTAYIRKDKRLFVFPMWLRINLV